MATQFDSPVYAKIALDLAGKIAAGELAEGQRLSGRSLLAGLYRVSPETVRRAIQLLEDIEIVQSNAGSGIVVLSREQALHYVERHHLLTGIREIRDEIRRLNSEKDEIEKQIRVLIERIEEQAARLQNVHPVYPYEVVVPEGSPLIGKTITDSQFWQNTSGTIVAIKRDSTIFYSPGPYAVFAARDVLFITGAPGVEIRSADYLQNG